LLSNPPTLKDNAQLEPDVVDFEPHTALFAGPDGRQALDTLLRGAKDVLTPGGFFCFELGLAKVRLYALLPNALRIRTYA